MINTTSLKSKLVAMLNEARTKSDETAMSEPYVSGFSDGQEAMLEKIIDIVTDNEFQYSEIDISLDMFLESSIKGAP